MTSTEGGTSDALAAAGRAAQVAATFADEVDRCARFPREALDAVRGAGLLSAWLPSRLGGRDATLAQMAEVTTVLGRACSATAMIFAMHQSQIACLMRHADTDPLVDLTRRVAREGLLVASATTEIGVGGDVRRSTTAVEEDGHGGFTLVKRAPVISYASESDIILVTARRNADAAPTDQVLVACEKADLDLRQTETWDTLGLRGTCSPGFELTARSSVAHILPTPYDEISTRTMLPVAHILWSACWLGIAEGAADKARRFVREQARRRPGSTPPGALRLAELDVRLAAFRARVRWAAEAFDASGGSERTIGQSIDDNVLKVFASEAVVDIVTRALAVVGIAGYSLASPWCLGRPLRDAHGAALMVNNDRILANTATLELVHRGERR
ncbi:acyl-CoA dehydrogenase family protein [Agilicoccus flavus]|uniref:acyl-CoA dehydrogenase family protein n=1 Tax=Agilicoccus flavus TaxID=2775968 RepID=UPI001CF67C7F|nr:acyl-CoA dehydrogenase family protein [Agilicoccus flavus]